MSEFPRENVRLELESAFLEEIQECDADVPAVIKDFLLRTKEEWVGVLRGHFQFDRGQCDDASVAIPDEIEMTEKLKGRFEVYWEEFTTEGCRDMNITGHEHSDPVDFEILLEEREMVLKGAALDTRTTFEEF